MACVLSSTKSTGMFTISTVPGELLTDLQKQGWVLDAELNNHKAPDQVQW